MRNSKRCPRFTRRSMTLTIGLALPVIASSTGAQETTRSNDGPRGLKEILVTAQRESTRKAIEQYREADAIQNFIASDDIGQFVDQNVAESLQRLPGINITRDQGEGRFVSTEYGNRQWHANRYA